MMYDEAKELNFSTLLTRNFLMVNKKILEYVGAESAIFLSVLLDKDYYHTQNNDLTEDGFFFETIEDMENMTKLSRYKQDTVIKILTDYNLLTTSVRGLPARRFFKIQHGVLNNLLKVVCRKTTNCENPATYPDNEKSTDCKKTTNLFDGNLQQYKTNISEQNQSSNSSADLRTPSFTKKTIIRKPIKASEIIRQKSEEQDQERKEQIKEKQFLANQVEISPAVQEVLDHWQGKGFTVHRNGTKALKCVVEDIEKVLNGTLFNDYTCPKFKPWIKQKFSVRDIKMAIDNFDTRAFDINYLPIKKEALQNILLKDFFFNRFTTIEELKSQFLISWCLPLTRTTENQLLVVKDDFPEVTKMIVSWYRSTFANKINGSFSLRDRNIIARTGKNLQNFAELHKDKLKISETHHRIVKSNGNVIMYLAIKLIEAMEKMLRNNDNLYAIFDPSWFNSDTTLTDRLPAQLKADGAM